MAEVVEIATPVGTARLHRHDVAGPRALLLLGHGAGGGVGTPDLLAATQAANALDVSVGLVEQPYRVAGRRAPAPARQLDSAWRAVATAAAAHVGSEAPALLVGGRSSGARVACRTAAATGAVGVLCLAFPLHPPGHPEKSRLAELEGVPATVPVLIVQGARDPFGLPTPAPGREVVVVPGTHSLSGQGPVRTAIADWLGALLMVREAGLHLPITRCSPGPA